MVFCLPDCLFRPSTLCLQPIARTGLCRSEPRGQHAEWRAGNIIHSHRVAELNGRRVAAVLGANSHLKMGASLASAFGSDANQFAHPVAINHREGSLFDDALREIGWQYFVHVVEREAERGLGEVIGTEAAERSFLGD